MYAAPVNYFTHITSINMKNIYFLFLLLFSLPGFTTRTIASEKDDSITLKARETFYRREISDLGNILTAENTWIYDSLLHYLKIQKKDIDFLTVSSEYGERLSNIGQYSQAYRIYENGLLLINELPVYS